MEEAMIGFGKTDTGKVARLITLQNANHMKVQISNYGAMIVSILIPQKNNSYIDVILGHSDVSQYQTSNSCMGATIGRNANRIENAEFVLNGKKYHLDKNEGNNNCHSGFSGFHKRMWNILNISEKKACFFLHSKDGDQGFPGNLDIKVTYELTDKNQLCIFYEGEADQDTIVNITNHCYFNLDGHNSGTILDQLVKINADYFLPVKDISWIPTGERRNVESTPMDFRKPQKIGKRLKEDFDQFDIKRDFNHCFILNKTKNEASEAYSEKSGIRMKLYTDLLALQFYTGGYLDAEPGKDNVIYGPNSGFCMEAEYVPNAINNEKEEQPILKKGEKYNKTIIYEFIW